MILGDVEETITSVEIDDETYEEIIKVRTISTTFLALSAASQPSCCFVCNCALRLIPVVCRQGLLEFSSLPLALPECSVCICRRTRGCYHICLSEGTESYLCRHLSVSDATGMHCTQLFFVLVHITHWQGGLGFNSKCRLV